MYIMYIMQRSFSPICAKVISCVDNTEQQILHPKTRPYLPKGFWCAESKSDIRNAPSRHVFEIP